MLSLRSDDRSATVRLWSLTDDALVEEGPEPGTLTVVSRWGELTVRDADAVAAESLRRMGFGPVTLRNTVPAEDGRADPTEGAVVALERVLDQVGFAVVHSLALPDGHGPLLSLEPVVGHPVFRPEPVDPQSLLRLSRFATLRPEDGVLTLQAPGAPFRVLLRRSAARAIATVLVAPHRAAELATEADQAPAVVADVLSFLLAAGVVHESRPDGTFAEDDDPGLSSWTPHELLFHQQSRTRQDGRTPTAPTPPATVPPVTAPAPVGGRYPLFRPDLATVADPTLTELLESDHLCPRFSQDGVTAEEVGELLYRAARVRSTGPAYLPTTGPDDAHDASQRPYASVACLYELEIYLTLGSCAGLPRGVYHYEPDEHALTLLDRTEADVRSFLDAGTLGAANTRPPAALLTITARLGRTAWAVPGAAYALALTHAGALQETLYLVAKAMQLWVHAVPADARGLDEALGLRWPAEVGVGECVIDRTPGSD